VLVLVLVLVPLVAGVLSVASCVVAGCRQQEGCVSKQQVCAVA
jgi:hypothetical protein